MGTLNSRRTGRKVCTVCAHPGIEEINRMLFLPNHPYPSIVEKMKQTYPGAEVISIPALSRHKLNHAVREAITVESAEGKTVYLPSSGVTRALTVNKEALPELGYTLPEALMVIINAGVNNILANPNQVSPQVMLAAAIELRKIGLGAGEKEDWETEFTKLAAVKEKMKREAKETLARTKQKRVREVRVTETTTVEETEDDTVTGDVVEGSVVENSPIVKILPDNGWGEEGGD